MLTRDLFMAAADPLVATRYFLNVDAFLRKLRRREISKSKMMPKCDSKCPAFRLGTHWETPNHITLFGRCPGQNATVTFKTLCYCVEFWSLLVKLSGAGRGSNFCGRDTGLRARLTYFSTEFGGFRSNGTSVLYGDPRENVAPRVSRPDFQGYVIQRSRHGSAGYHEFPVAIRNKHGLSRTVFDTNDIFTQKSLIYPILCVPIASAEEVTPEMYKY